MESLILYIFLLITLITGLYLVFKINSIQKNFDKEPNKDEISSLKDLINSQINSVSSSLKLKWQICHHLLIHCRRM